MNKPASRAVLGPVENRRANSGLRPDDPFPIPYTSDIVKFITSTFLP